MLKEHNAKQQLHKEMQEKRKNETIVSLHELSDAVVENLNQRVSCAYTNQKRLDIECKKLEKNGLNLTRYAEQWMRMIESFNDALKEIGDVETWSNTIENDVEVIAETIQEGKISQS